MALTLTQTHVRQHNNRHHTPDVRPDSVLRRCITHDTQSETHVLRTYTHTLSHLLEGEGEEAVGVDGVRVAVGEAGEVDADGRPRRLEALADAGVVGRVGCLGVCGVG